MGHKFIMLSVSAIILFVSLCPASQAQENVRNWSLGCGPTYGGIGIRYLLIGKDSPFGFSAGLGSTLIGVGSSLGIAARTSGEYCIDIAAVGGVRFLTNYWGIEILFGNLPVQRNKLFWRIGMGYMESEEILILVKSHKAKDFYPTAAIGWTL